MEEIMIGREMNPKEMIPEEENQEGAKIFGKLAGASLLYALVYTGCLFENVMGLASVLWVASSVWYVRFVFRMFGEKERRDNGIVLGMIVLLGISNVLTGNEWIGWMNDLIIFVLLVGILLHNFAQDTGSISENIWRRLWRRCAGRSALSGSRLRMAEHFTAAKRQGRAMRAGMFSSGSARRCPV